MAYGRMIGRGGSLAMLGGMVLVVACGKVSDDFGQNDDENPVSDPTRGRDGAQEEERPTMTGGLGTVSDGGTNQGTGAARGSGASASVGGSEGTGASAGDGGMGGDDGQSDPRRQTIEPTWVTPFEVYGLGSTRIGFSPSEGLVEITAGEYESVTLSLQSETGELVDEILDESLNVAAISRNGRTIVREIDSACTVFVDTAASFELPGDCRPIHLDLSDDGSVLSQETCEGVGEDRFLQLTVYDVKTASVLVEKVTDLSCVYQANSTVLDPSDQRVYFTHPDFGHIFALSWDTQQLSRRTIHQEVEPDDSGKATHVGPVVDLSLSPNGDVLVSVGARDGLAFLDPETLNVEAGLSEVPFFNHYDACFTTFLSRSPVAWTRDAAYFGTTNTDGGITVRAWPSTEVIYELTPPEATDVLCHDPKDYAPLLLEFSPDGSQVVVVFQDAIAGYFLDP